MQGKFDQATSDKTSFVHHFENSESLGWMKFEQRAKPIQIPLTYTPQLDCHETNLLGQLERFDEYAHKSQYAILTSGPMGTCSHCSEAVSPGTMFALV